MLNKWKKFTKFTNHKVEKKQKDERKNTDNICIPGTNISLD
jgi:hypothetical protein